VDYGESGGKKSGSRHSYAAAVRDVADISFQGGALSGNSAGHSGGYIAQAGRTPLQVREKLFDSRRRGSDVQGVSSQGRSAYRYTGRIQQYGFFAAEGHV